MSERHQHLLLRGSRKIDVNGLKIDIVEAHDVHFKRSEHVALGKFGRAPSRRKLTILVEQLTKGVETFLYLAFREKQAFTAVAAPIAEIIAEGEGPKINQTPDFYANALEKPRFWVLLSAPFSPADLSNLSLTKGDRAVSEVMAECRTSLMYVQSDRSEAKE